MDDSYFVKAILYPLRNWIACTIFFLPTTGWSQEVITNPRGYYVAKIAGITAGETQKRTYLGVQLTAVTKGAEGLVGNVSGDAFSLPYVASPQEVYDPTRTAYLHVIDGTGRGFISDIVEFRQNDFKCAATLAPWMAVGTRVRICYHPNLTDLFGSTNQFSLASGTSADLTDNVVAWDAVAQQEKIYYYHSFRQRWEEKNVNADAGLAALKFPYGIYIIRRSSGNLRISLSGEISAAPILLPVRTGDNVFSLPINLSSSLANIIPESGAFSPIKGRNTNRADLITLEEPYSGLQKGPFYLSSRPNALGWRKVGANTHNETLEPIDFLSTLIINRRGPAGFVRVEGSLEPGPQLLIPENADPGETPLFGEISFSHPLPPDVLAVAEVSMDLQNWSFSANAELVNGVFRFPLPSGQGRAFYRIKATLE